MLIWSTNHWNVLTACHPRIKAVHVAAQICSVVIILLKWITGYSRLHLNSRESKLVHTLSLVYEIVLSAISSTSQFQFTGRYERRRESVCVRACVCGWWGRGGGASFILEGYFIFGQSSCGPNNVDDAFQILSVDVGIYTPVLFKHWSSSQYRVLIYIQIMREVFATIIFNI